MSSTSCFVGVKINRKIKMCSWWLHFPSDVGEIISLVWGDVCTITVDNGENNYL